MSSYISFFEKTFLFNGVDRGTIEHLLKNITIEEKSFVKGDTIYSPVEYEKKIGFVYSGECIVARDTHGSFVPLNVLRKYNSFGIIAILSDSNEFPTVIKAKNSCTVLFFSACDVISMLKEHHTVSMNIISFLTAKINFLNDKIAAFSAGSVEEKLASYILGIYKKYNSLEFELNKKNSAEALNCGRASLYRAIEALETGGYISVENKKIHINDLEGLERIRK